MNLPVIIVGCGGHAKVLIEALELMEIKVIGVTDIDENLYGKGILGVPVIGNDEVLINYPPDQIKLVNGIGSINSNKRRRELFQSFKGKGFSFQEVIHPRAYVSATAKLGEGVQILPGAVVQVGSEIGENTIINTSASVDHDCLIGNNVHIAPGATISGGAVIEDGVHVGAGATVIQQVRIGEGGLIGAGAVVINNVPRGHLAVGVPAVIKDKSF